MQQVWVRARDAERGSLPARCARSGKPCISRYRRPASSLPAWAEWLGWSGLWPLRRNTTAAAPRVILPLLPGVASRRRALRSVRDASAGVLLVGLAAWFPLAGIGVLGIGVRLLTAAALGLHLLVAPLGLVLDVTVTPDSADGEWLLLRNVHRDFVTAVERSLERPDRTPPLGNAAPSLVGAATTEQP